MQTTYLLLKDEPEKSAFDLDDGLWMKLFTEDVTKLSEVSATRGALAERIAEEVRSGAEGLCCLTNPTQDHWMRCDHCREYYETVSKRLFDWCGDADVRLVNDIEFDLKFVFSHLITQDVFV